MTVRNVLTPVLRPVLNAGIGFLSGSGVGFPIDGSPTLILNFAENSDLTLSLDFSTQIYRKNELDPSNPTPAIGSYFKWE